MQSADDAIIGAWRDEIISEPNAYVLARVDEVESKPKFGPFDDRLLHTQIQEDMILLAAHAIAEATTWIAFLPTTDKKIETLNRLIKIYKRKKKTTWKNGEEDMDERIKKITAMDIFILMWKDLRNRLQTSADIRRPSFVDRMTQSFQSFTSTFRPRPRQPNERIPVIEPATWWGPFESDDYKLGGSKRNITGRKRGGKKRGCTNKKRKSTTRRK